VPLEERKFKEISEQQFGERPGRDQARICEGIMAKTGKLVCILNFSIVQELLILDFFNSSTAGGGHLT